MAEYCIRGATKDGKVLFIRRRFVSKSAAEKYPISMSSWGSAMCGERTSGCDAESQGIWQLVLPIWRSQPPPSIVIYPRYAPDLPLPKPGLETAGKLAGVGLCGDTSKG
jgi:hypothetical protein